MGRDTCKDCLGPREHDAPNQSYCRECSRKRQRNRYRETRLAAGLSYTSMTDHDTDRRSFLIAGEDKPGPCESCGQPEPDGLVLLFEGDPVANRYYGGKPFALWCRECHTLLQSLNTQQLRRLMLAHQYLAKRDVSRERILMTMEMVVEEDSRNAPPRSRRKPNEHDGGHSNEQKSTAGQPLQGNPGAAI